jgi:hypothetical protein
MISVIKNIYLVCLLLLLCIYATPARSQGIDKQGIVDVGQMVFNQWTNVYSNETVEISIMKVDCIDPINDIDIRKIFYKVSNKSNDFVAIQWDQMLDFGDRIIQSSDAKTEYRKRFALKPGESIQGDCAYSNNDKVVFVKRLKPEHEMTLLRLQLLNVNIYR